MPGDATAHGESDWAWKPGGAAFGAAVFSLDEVDECFDAMVELKREGVLRALGTSNFGRPEMGTLRRDGVPCFGMRTRLPEGEWAWGSPSFKSLGQHKVELEQQHAQRTTRLQALEAQVEQRRDGCAVRAAPAADHHRRLDRGRRRRVDPPSPIAAFPRRRRRDRKA